MGWQSLRIARSDALSIARSSAPLTPREPPRAGTPSPKRIAVGAGAGLDFGTHSAAPCDYPDFVRPVALAVSADDFDRGIVLGGSGNGEAMVANRVRGVRCGLCWTEQVAI